MKKILIQYTNIIGYTICGLLFAFSSFYLILNLFHQRELNTYYKVDPNTLDNYVSVTTKINKMKENIEENPNRVNNSSKAKFLSNLKSRLNTCSSSLINETFKGFGTKDAIGPLDVEHFRTSFQSDVLSKCLISQFYGLTSETDEIASGQEEFMEIAPYIHLTIENMLPATSYLEDDLANNGSYYFNSDLARTTVHDKTVSGFHSVLTLYNQASDLLVEISNWYLEQVKGE